MLFEFKFYFSSLVGCITKCKKKKKTAPAPISPWLVGEEKVYAFSKSNMSI